MSLLRSNLLNKALKIIPSENYQYLKFNGDEVNDFGVKIPVYDSPQTITKGMVQSVENSMYQQLGLDLDKNYKIFYGSVNINGNESQAQPDRFIYDGKTYETIRNTNWFNYDGWSGVLAVELKRDRNDGN